MTEITGDLKYNPQEVANNLLAFMQIMLTQHSSPEEISEIVSAVGVLSAKVSQEIGRTEEQADIIDLLESVRQFVGLILTIHRSPFFDTLEAQAAVRSLIREASFPDLASDLVIANVPTIKVLMGEG